MLILLTKSCYYVLRETCLMAYNVFYKEPKESLECLLGGVCEDECEDLAAEPSSMGKSNKPPPGNRSQEGSQTASRRTSTSRLYPAETPKATTAVPSMTSSANPVQTRDQGTDAVPRRKSQPTSTEFATKSTASITTLSFPNPDKYAEKQDKGSRTTDLAPTSLRHSYSQVSSHTRDAASTATVPNTSKATTASATTDVKKTTTSRGTNTPNTAANTAQNTHAQPTPSGTSSSSSTAMSPQPSTSAAGVGRPAVSNAGVGTVRNRPSESNAAVGTDPNAGQRPTHHASSMTRSVAGVTAPTSQDQLSPPASVPSSPPTGVSGLPHEALSEGAFLNQVASELRSPGAGRSAAGPRSGRMGRSANDNTTSTGTNADGSDSSSSQQCPNWFESLPANLREWIWLLTYAALFLFLVLHLVFLGYHYNTIQKIRNANQDEASDGSGGIDGSKGYLAPGYQGSQAAQKGSRGQTRRAGAGPGGGAGDYEPNDTGMAGGTAAGAGGATSSSSSASAPHKCAHSHCKHKTFDYYDCMHKNENDGSSLEKCLNIA